MWVLFELLCCWCVLGIPFSVKYGIVGWTLQTLIGYLSTYIDYVFYPHFKKNMADLMEHGWKPWQVWSIMLFNLSVTNALVGAIYVYCQNAPMQIDGLTFVQLFINMSITEVLFTAAHAMLHYTELGSKIHEMHHCCQQASWSTNLIFHPLDITAEFSGPVISIILMHVFVWKNTASLFLSTIVLHLWYALDHSANLKLPHSKHHSQLNTVFTIYLKQRCTCRRKDKVRALIKAKVK